MISPALLAFAISSFDKSRNIVRLGWRPGFRYWMIITLTLAMVIVSLLLVASVLGHFELNDRTVKKFFRLSTVTALITGILLNTGEEAGWRGYLFPSLVREKGWWKAVFIVSGVWWLWHAPFMAVLQLRMVGQIQYSTQTIQLFSLIPVTVIFGIWMKGSNSFWAIGFAHQLINFSNKWFLGLEHSEKAPMFFGDKSYASIYSTENGILGVIAMGGLATAMYLYAREKRPDLLLP